MDLLLEKYRKLSRTSSENMTTRELSFAEKAGNTDRSLNKKSDTAKRYRGTYIPKPLKLEKLITIEDLLGRSRRERKATRNILFPAKLSKTVSQVDPKDPLRPQKDAARA